MFIDCKLVLKSYIPEKLEKGMWFVRVKTEVIYGDKQEYLHVFELDIVPRDMETYLTYNGYPVKPYLVYPMIKFVRATVSMEHPSITTMYISYGQYLFHTINLILNKQIKK